MIYSAIVACEVAFWAFLGAGLVTRYVLNLRRASTPLLLGSPIADFLLVILVAVDVQAGTAPTQAHALAATYLGFSVVFGPDLVRWADRRVAARLGRGLEMGLPTRNSTTPLRDEWQLFFKAARAWAITVAILFALAALSGDLDDAAPLPAYAATLTLILGVWFVAGPVLATGFLPPSRPGRSSEIDMETNLQSPSKSGVKAPAGEPPDSRSANAWAPWWVYAIVILGVNYLRQLVLPHGTLAEWAVVLLVVGISGALFIATTAAYRLTPGRVTRES
jgi:hypothetical protein